MYEKIEGNLMVQNETMDFKIGGIEFSVGKLRTDVKFLYLTS